MGGAGGAGAGVSPIEILAAELAADPLGRGYAAMTHDQAAASLNSMAPDDLRVRSRAIGSRELLAWSAAGGRFASLEDAAAAHADKQVRSVARAASYMVMREDTSFEPGRHGALVDTLVAGGVFSATDRESLLALASERVARAVELGLPAGWVTAGRVEVARG